MSESTPPKSRPFAFGTRSITELRGVKPALAWAAYRALKLSTVDFGVIQGLRTHAAQLKLYEAGKSKVTSSRHETGDAIDIMAYLGANGTWESQYYAHIAWAFSVASHELKTPIRWGGCWMVLPYPTTPELLQLKVEEYVAFRKKQGKASLIDLGHFEIPRQV